ncbi:hypothetical protein QV65_04625 [Rhodococcus erythropolis]|nr:hypothetical protein QV65_04625 [Rhodococcus erythropolis]
MVTKVNLEICASFNSSRTQVLPALYGTWPGSRSQKGPECVTEEFGRVNLFSTYREFRFADGLGGEKSNSPGKSVNKSVEFGVWMRTIYPAVFCSHLRVEIITADNNFECSGPADKAW